MAGIIVLGLLVVSVIGMIVIPAYADDHHQYPDDCDRDKTTMKKFNSDKIHCVWTESAEILEKRGWGYTGVFYDFILDYCVGFGGIGRCSSGSTWDITKNYDLQKRIYECSLGTIPWVMSVGYVGPCELTYYNGTVFDILHTTEPERWIAGN